MSAKPLPTWSDLFAEGSAPEWTLLTCPGRPPARIAQDPAAYAGRDYGGPHETTHEINARLRNLYGRGWNACYCLRGLGALLKEPRNVTLRHVAAAVPMSSRGTGYQLYLVDQAAWWDDRPLYVIDEWGAYLNGLECYLDTGNQNAGISLTRAREFSVYAGYLVQQIQARDPGYEFTQLERLIAWQRERLARLEQQAAKKRIQTVLTISSIDEMVDTQPSEPGPGTHTARQSPTPPDRPGPAPKAEGPFAEGPVRSIDQAAAAVERAANEAADTMIAARQTIAWTQQRLQELYDGLKLLLPKKTAEGSG